MSGMILCTNTAAQVLKPIIIEDKRQYVHINSATPLFDGPSNESKILYDDYGNREMLTELCEVLVSEVDETWYSYEYENGEKRIKSFFARDFADPVLTKGISDSKAIYVVPVGDQPENDIGCWEPSQSAYFVYPNHLCVTLNVGLMSTMELGLLQGGAIKPVWIIPVVYEIDHDNPNNFKFHIPAPNVSDEPVRISIGSNCLLKNKGIKEDQLGIPDMFIWGANDIVSLFVPNSKPVICMNSAGIQPFLMTMEWLESLGAKRYDAK